MSDCYRCNHPKSEHSTGRCQHTTNTERIIDSGNPADGITIEHDMRLCDCLQFAH